MSIFVGFVNHLQAQLTISPEPIVSVETNYNKDNISLGMLDINQDEMIDIIYNENDSTKTTFYAILNRNGKEFMNKRVLVEIDSKRIDKNGESITNDLISKYTILDYDNDGDFDLVVLIKNKKRTFLEVYLNTNEQFGEPIEIFDFNSSNVQVKFIESVFVSENQQIIVVGDQKSDDLYFLKRNISKMKADLLNKVKAYDVEQIYLNDFDKDFDFDLVVGFNPKTSSLRVYVVNNDDISYQEIAISDFKDQKNVDYSSFNTNDLFGYGNRTLIITPKLQSKSESNLAYAIKYVEQNKNFKIIDTIYLQVPENGVYNASNQIFGACLSNTNLCDLIHQTGNNIYFLKNKYIKRAGELSNFETPKLMQEFRVSEGENISLLRPLNFDFGNHEIVYSISKKDKINYYFGYIKD